MEDSTPAKTPMATVTILDQDESGKKVDITHYRGMIGSLLYLTASRPDIMFATCLCARFQADPKESHLIAVKRIFRYLKGTPNLGIWYPKDTGFDLTGYTDSDYAGWPKPRLTDNTFGGAPHSMLAEPTSLPSLQGDKSSSTRLLLSCMVLPN
ncbi:putative mitochondrial protein AtMg00240 [Apium graveolens]|uniref:putative mitochondrial protein AtMg00240 n=1 Tax=Apium graveolens TaxID=4045 RepID=UPI003D7BCD02